MGVGCYLAPILYNAIFTGSFHMEILFKVGL